MEKHWKSPQAMIVGILIALIFCYIIIDLVFTKPKIEKDVKDVRNKYVELSTFLDKKIPEIDSTFKTQALQIKQQKDQMDTLKYAFKKLN